MKFIQLLITIIVLGFSEKLSSQTVDHSSVSNLEVYYADTENPIEKKVTISCILNFKNANAVSSAKLFIVDTDTNLEVYSVEYTLNSGTVTNTDNAILFMREGNKVSINSDSKYDLKPYIYKIITKNIEGQESEVF